MTDYFDDHLSLSSHNSSFMLFDDDIFFEKQKSDFDPCASFKLVSPAVSQNDLDQFFNLSSVPSTPAPIPNVVKAEPVSEYEPRQEIMQPQIQDGKDLFTNFLHLINLQQIEDTKIFRMESVSTTSGEECYSSETESSTFVFSNPSSPASPASTCSSMDSTNPAGFKHQSQSQSYSGVNFVCSTPVVSPAPSTCNSPKSGPIKEPQIFIQNETKIATEIDYYKLWIESQHEVKQLKQAIEDITQKISLLEDQNSSKYQQSTAPTISLPKPKLSQVEPPSLCLRVCSEFQRTWYTDRAFPSFTVGLFDSATLQPYLDISGWRVTVSLIDGHGKDATSKFCGASGPAPLSFAISRGRSVINGLRFSSVSSKNGGCFQLVMRVVNPFATELPSPKLNDIEYLSEPIQILSYRLFHVPKLESDMLFPSDPLWKVKGIGPLYAKRFSELGISTIKDLASIDLESLSEDEVRNYVNSLRRDRGALTPAKLFEYVSQAREIVARDTKPSPTTLKHERTEQESDPSIAHAPKRIRV